MVAFDAHGHSGGFALLWRYKEEVSLFSLGKNHIDVGIKCENMAEYRLTGVYGEPNRSLSSMGNDWDINNILNQTEKKGGAATPMV